MYYGQIYFDDVANGPGIRTSFFVSGCTHRCKGCFNEETWDFKYGTEYDKGTEDRIVKSLKPTYVAGLTILGGEPMEPSNQEEIRPLLERIKAEVPGANIWIYTGYTFEELTDKNNKRCHTADTEAILRMTDVLVDGEFVLEKKDISLNFRGSSNQRIIDVPASFSEGGLVLSPLND